MYSLVGKKVWIAGHRGMVGQALMRRLAFERCDILTINHADLDCRDQAAVNDWVGANKPDVIYIAAARVGGIMDNANNPAEFFYDNMMIAANIMHAAYLSGAERVIFLGSSCIYPKHAAQPISENALLSDVLEPTNEAYALAKIGGVKMADYYSRQYGCHYSAAMPCNLFGAGDTYDAQNSHVIPAMIMKAHAAKQAGQGELVLWGTGSPLREFLWVDDLADGLVFMTIYGEAPAMVNIGTGHEVTIKDLANMICEIVGYTGKVVFDETKPDGTPRKVMDISHMQSLGWEAPNLLAVNYDYDSYLRDKISLSYQDYLKII
ncbi:MAG: GDP-L-fucose synthase family protein [Alcanivorax sp.]